MAAQNKRRKAMQCRSGGFESGKCISYKSYHHFKILGGFESRKCIFYKSIIILKYQVALNLENASLTNFIMILKYKAQAGLWCLY